MIPRYWVIHDIYSSSSGSIISSWNVLLVSDTSLSKANLTETLLDAIETANGDFIDGHEIDTETVSSRGKFNT